MPDELERGAADLQGDRPTTPLVAADRATPRRARGAIETISAEPMAMDFRLGLSSLQIASYLLK